MDAVARRTASAGTWNCPTLIVNDKHVPQARMREWMKDPFLGYLPPSVVAMWDPEQWDTDRRRQMERMDADPGLGSTQRH